MRPPELMFPAGSYVTLSRQRAPFGAVHVGATWHLGECNHARKAGYKLTAHTAAWVLHMNLQPCTYCTKDKV